MNNKRAQRAAEQILTDSSLTDDMNDAEATRLIDWAVAVAKSLALQTVNMDDATAEDYLDPPMKNLRRTVKQFNKLLADMDSMDSAAFQDSVNKVFETAQTIDVLNPPHGRDLFDYDTMMSLQAEERITTMLTELAIPLEQKLEPLTDPGPRETQPMEPFSAKDIESLQRFGFDVSRPATDDSDQPSTKDE